MILGSKKLWDPALNDQELMKAFDLTAGQYQIEDEIDKEISNALDEMSELRANLPRRPGSGSQYLANRRTARGSGAWVNDTEEPSDDKSTVNQKGYPYKTPLFRGKVTRKMQAEGKTYGDALQEEIENGLEVIKQMEESSIILGDLNSDPKEPDGLKRLCSSANFSRTEDIAASLTLAKLDEAIDAVDDPNMIITSRRTRREINALLSARQTYNDKIEINGGFRVLSYDNIPIVTNLYIPINEGTGTNESRLYVISAGKDVFISELTALKFERLAKTSSQFDLFDMFEDIVLAVKNPRKIYEIEGIQPPS